MMPPTALDLLPGLGSAAGDGPDAVAIGDAHTSREDLAAAAGLLATRLRGASMVTLSATPTLDTVVGVLGALFAGVPIAPVAPDAGPLERDHVLRDSGAEIVLGDPDWPDVGLPRIPVPRPGAGGAGPSAPLPPAAPLVLYTSGTTGPPKGVVLPPGAIAADLDALADAWAWTPDDVLVHGLPLFHVHGLILGVLGALRTGCRVVHTGRPTPAAYAGAAGTLYFGVPTVWSRLCQEPGAARALRGARLLVSGSAALTPPVFEALVGLTGHRPVERYGMTETLITVSSRADSERRPGLVGTPLRGVSTRVVAEDGAVLPSDGDAVGELQVRTPTMFDGYLGDPAAGAASWTADGWFRTGDVAVVGPDGWHRIVGRASVDMIKSGGYRIGAGEVEAALLAHPGVREAAVIGAPDADLGQSIVAFVVADGVRAEDLTGFVARGLSVHKRPRRIVFVDALPRNALGKVQKARLVS
jgi:fatty acid CoA ligase FadD36